MPSIKNIRLLKLILFILLYPYQNFAHAQEFRPEAIMNLGSSIAHLALCEIERFSKKQSASELIIATHSILSRDSYNKVRDQIQKSMHEKKIYSIHYDKWIPMQINKENCLDLEKSAPLLINHFKNIEQHQREK